MRIFVLIFTLLSFFPVEFANSNELLKKLENKNKNQIQKKINSIEVILDCKMLNISELKEGKYKTFLRSDIPNAEISDGYVHINFNENYVISNLGMLSHYGKILKGVDKNRNVLLEIYTGDKTFEVIAALGFNLDVPFQGGLRQRNTFVIDKYNLKMTMKANKIFRDEKAFNGIGFDKDQSIINYQCQRGTKPNS